MFTYHLLQGRVHYGVIILSSSPEFCAQYFRKIFKIEVQTEDSPKEGYDALQQSHKGVGLNYAAQQHD